MVFYVMYMSDNVIAMAKVSPLEPSDYNVSKNKNQMCHLDKTVEKTIGD